MNGRPSPDQATPSSSRRDQRGAVLPSPVVWLSIVAVAVAAVAFVVTNDADPKEREITTSSANDGTDEATDAQTPADDEESSEPTESATPEEPKKTKPPVDRSQVGVVVFNNTSITGLASETLARVQEIGWNGLAADNWYGTIPATTVYFPQGMRDAAQKLALDLGIQRLVPADPAMSDTSLTVILTGALT